jgi:hypothetical protein
LKIYFVTTNKSKAEFEVLEEIKPPRLLLSYFYFRNKPLSEVVEELGYQPEIMLDSGAYSAHTSGRGIALTDYMRYINENQKYITHYVSLDVFGDNEISFWYYEIMKNKGFDPLPVVHYGAQDMEYLKKYMDQGARYIALGGTVPIKNKWDVSEWVRLLSWQYPEVDFHLLGSSSRKIIDHCDMCSCDSSSWFMMAINGYPKHIKGRDRQAKIKRAKWQMEKMMTLEQEPIEKEA